MQKENVVFVCRHTGWFSRRWGERHFVWLFRHTDRTDIWKDQREGDTVSPFWEEQVPTGMFTSLARMKLVFAGCGLTRAKMENLSEVTTNKSVSTNYPEGYFTARTCRWQVTKALLWRMCTLDKKSKWNLVFHIYQLYRIVWSQRKRESLLVIWYTSTSFPTPSFSLMSILLT